MGPMKLGAKLPGPKTGLNGLPTLHAAAMKPNATTMMVVMEVAVKGVYSPRDGEDPRPELEIIHIEGVDGELAERARKILHQAWDGRKSNGEDTEPMPMDF